LCCLIFLTNGKLDGFSLAMYLNFSMELMKCISLRGGRATFWYLASGIKRKAKFVRTLHPPLLSAHTRHSIVILQEGPDVCVAIFDDVCVSILNFDRFCWQILVVC
jgi:hypothetical protein